MYFCLCIYVFVCKLNFFFHGDKIIIHDKQRLFYSTIEIFLFLLCKFLLFLTNLPLLFDNGFCFKTVFCSYLISRFNRYVVCLFLSDIYIRASIRLFDFIEKKYHLFLFSLFFFLLK